MRCSTCLGIPSETERAYFALHKPNSQIAKQLHISKKFDEKSSHLLLLVWRCALRCRSLCFFFFFFFICSVSVYFCYFTCPCALYKRRTSIVCVATRKCRLNLEWSKTINLKQYGIAMPPAKQTINLHDSDLQWETRSRAREWRRDGKKCNNTDAIVRRIKKFDAFYQNDTQNTERERCASTIHQCSEQMHRCSEKRLLCEGNQFGDRRLRIYRSKTAQRAKHFFPSFGTLLPAARRNTFIWFNNIAWCSMRDSTFSSSTTIATQSVQAEVTKSDRSFRWLSRKYCRICSSVCSASRSVCCQHWRSCENNCKREWIVVFDVISENQILIYR